MPAHSDLPPLRALRVLAVVSRVDRHADAATELGVTASAVSQQIRILERWIGTNLFDRSTKSPKLTETGRALFDGIAAPLARIDGVCQAIKRSSDHRTVVVSAPGAYLSYRFIPSLHAFWKQNPEIDVDIRMAARFDAPIEGRGIDLAIRFCMTTRLLRRSVAAAGGPSVTARISKRLAGPKASPTSKPDSFCTSRFLTFGRGRSKRPDFPFPRA